jgi:hypothetical protein
VLKKYLLLLMLIVYAARGYGQNLVPNGSFEQGADLCPLSSDVSQMATGWNAPSGSSDIFSVRIDPQCFTAMPYSRFRIENPYTSVGSQMPRTGDRFAGIYIYSGHPGVYEACYREYLQVKLNRTLNPGQSYCFEMYVSLGGGSGYASNKISVALSEKAINASPYDYLLALTPQFTEERIITDTTGWTKIEATLVPASPAQYMVIGNFFDDDHTAPIVINQERIDNLFSTNAYYFIDDVSLEQNPRDEFVFSGALDVCEGDTLHILADAGADDVTWTTLQDPGTVIATGPELSLVARQTTTYMVSAWGCGKFVTGTVRVTVNTRPSVELGEDLTICSGDSVVLDAGGGQAAYQWNVGQQGQTLVVKEPGAYSLEVINTYNCRTSDQINIGMLFPPHIDLGRDTLLCNSDFFLLRGGAATKYLWSTGSEASSITPVQSGLYWLRSENECGTDTDSISVFSIANLFIPNVVTPNNDALNDRLSIGGIGDAHGYMHIYNRWGGEIYAAPNYRNEWPEDGSYPEDGVYFYTYAIPGCAPYKGWVHLRR